MKTKFINPHLMPDFSLLSIGDSYTIGELVPLHESFPYQLIQLLRNKAGSEAYWLAPEIVAKTGWTTDELSSALAMYQLLPSYDFVTLLIGVNNQYRGREVAEFEQEFSSLLEKAVKYAGGKAHHVFVLSIPDWGATAFAIDKNPDLIAQQIDAYNLVCKVKSESMACHFIEITEAQRRDSAEEGFLASDGLHPSGKEYAKWAVSLAHAIDSVKP
jgi:lysophospholipase L1-like esterase